MPDLAADALEDELRESGVALKPSEVRAIAERLGRNPTLVEAHAFDAQWSEHCSYKSSRKYVRTLPSEGPSVVLGPREDAGVVHLGEWQGKRYGIVIAHESHNHPSQVVPFEGAATGIGGIVRDVLCMGAQLIALADPLRFGPRDDPHARYVAQGVVDGIAAYGNAIGVPTICGDVYFHEGFRDNALVNVIALGIVEEDAIVHSAAPPNSAGWNVVLVGKATDRSGFGGAAFSSLALDEADAEANKGAVQVPDPFLASVLMRASYRAFARIRELGLTVGFKDLGAGGIMGCTAELCASGGFGARIDLDRCPTSQESLPPAVIAVGETQERLAWVVSPEFTPELLAIYNDEFSLPAVARGAQAAVIGTVTAERDYVLLHGGEEVMHVPIDFLTGGIAYDRPCTLPQPRALPSDGPTTLREADLFSMADILERVIVHLDVCSRRPIYERYDSVVRGATSIPCGYSDAGVIVPVDGAPLAAALAVAGNPRYALIDCALAAEHAVVEAVRNVAAVGATPAALTDCLNFGNPEIPEQMGEFAASVDGIGRAARELGLPYVSGNVSLYNQSASGASIPPSPILACVGTLADVSRSATQALKNADSAIYRLGTVPQTLGGSVVADVAGFDPEALPPLDYAALRNELAALIEAHEHGLIAAAHDISDGGTLVALAEMSFAGGAQLGVRFERELTLEEAFAECAGFAVETQDAAAFESMCKAHGAKCERLGTTTREPRLGIPGKLDASLSELMHAWSAPLGDFYDEVPQA